jgi:hypothetical protein
MAFKTSRVTVGTTATALNSSAASMTVISVKVPTGSTLYVGGKDVTSATGWPVDGGTIGTFDLELGEMLYAVVASGSVVVPVLLGGA